MNSYNRRRMEMLERVDQFGKNTELTLTTIITALFALVGTYLTAMRDWVAGQATGNGGFREGAAIRRALYQQIVAALRDIRAAAIGMQIAGDAGVSEQFRLPRSLTYANVLATARSFATNAAALTAAFTARGLPATFITDLQAKITAFDAATAGKNEGKAARIGSTAALKAAADGGLKSVQELRALMPMQLRATPDLLAAWKAAARVETPVRQPKSPETGGSGPTPTEPPSSGS